ncbi:GroES-like protein [Sanghuangporus baumii]|uniref:GroES-like protein n=1 Tax=Sanghuangporus baumii TaxID=108892 RepID=A0A9Q5I0B0_SANBA|nr:GroES-like protein [Sanghuangporus baumii]
MASIPSEQLGVLSTKTSETLQTFPVPSPGPGEVLIQNVAVASNPKDWKVHLFIENYSAIEGNDVAGIIVKVGEGVTEYKGGERVAAFSIMYSGNNKASSSYVTFACILTERFVCMQYGAYAQYTVAPAETTFPIPESTSFDEAATLPLAVGTAFIGLFKRLGIPEKPSGTSTSLRISLFAGVLIWLRKKVNRKVLS